MKYLKQIILISFITISIPTIIFSQGKKPVDGIFKKPIDSKKLDDQIELKSASVKSKFIKKSNNGDDISIIKNKRSAVSFNAYTIEELSKQEGRALKDDDTLTIEYNDDNNKLVKRTVDVSDYIAELNEIEKRMNSYGRSTRTDDSVVTGIDNDESKLNQQKSAIPIGGKFKTIDEINTDFSKSNIVNGKTAKSIDDVTNDEFNAITDRQRTLKGIKSKTTGIQAIKPGSLSIGIAKPPLLVSTFQHTAQKKWEFGSKDKVYLGLSADATLSGQLYKTADTLSLLPIEQAREIYKKSATRLTLRANAKAEGSIFNNGFTMLSANSNLDYPVHKDSNARLKLNAEVAGFSIFGIDKSFKSYTKDEEKSYIFNKKFSKTFTLVVPVTVSVGAEGNLGVKYHVLVDKSTLDAKITPYAKVIGKATCDVDLFIIRAGVEAKLTVIDGSINLAGRSDIFFTDQGFLFRRNFQCGYNLKLLSGAITARVQRRNWRWQWKTIWSHDLFTWNGFNYSGSFDSGNVTNEDTYINW